MPCQHLSEHGASWFDISNSRILMPLANTLVCLGDVCNAIYYDTGGKRFGKSINPFA